MTKVRQLWLLTALASLAVVVVGYFLVVSPKASAAKALRTEADEQRSANTALKSKVQMLNQQKKDLPKLQAELDAFGIKIPSNPALPSLVRALSDAADKSGVNLVSVTPSVPVFGSSASAGNAPVVANGGPTLANIPITMKVTGGYSQVQEFFQAVEEMPRAFLLTATKIEPDKGGDGTTSAVASNTLTAEMTGRLFMMTKAPDPVTPVAAPTDATS
jgi:Tfp pilus assembly protein PilO